MNNTTPTQNLAWRSTFDVTEAQATVIVALIVAHQLGYDGATVRGLRWVGVKESGLHDMADLRRAQLIEVVGHDETRATVYRATARAFRRFGVPLERPLPAVAESAVEHKERMLDNEEDRRREGMRRRYQRQREGA